MKTKLPSFHATLETLQSEFLIQKSQLNLEMISLDYSSLVIHKDAKQVKEPRRQR